MQKKQEKNSGKNKSCQQIYCAVHKCFFPFPHPVSCCGHKSHPAPHLNKLLKHQNRQHKFTAKAAVIEKGKHFSHFTSTRKSKHFPYFEDFPCWKVPCVINVIYNTQSDPIRSNRKWVCVPVPVHEHDIWIGEGRKKQHITTSFHVDCFAFHIKYPIQCERVHSEHVLSVFSLARFVYYTTQWIWENGLYTFIRRAQYLNKTVVFKCFCEKQKTKKVSVFLVICVTIFHRFVRCV